MLLPVLRASSAAHPRLHALWPSLLSLLLPGHTPSRVRSPRTPPQSAAFQDLQPSTVWLSPRARPCTEVVAWLC